MSCPDCICNPTQIQPFDEIIEPKAPVSKVPFSQKIRDYADYLLPIAEKICCIALAIFAAYINLKLFAISAGIGIGLGIAYSIYKIMTEEKIEPGLSRPSCAQGFFDYLSGIRYHPLVSTVITAVFIAGHMHHSPFYIGFCGVPIGIRVGKELTMGAYNFYQLYIKKTPQNQAANVV